MNYRELRTAALALSLSSLVLSSACDGGAAGESNDKPLPRATFGTEEANAPSDPDGLADVIAKTTAAMLAHGDASSAERYAADVFDRTGCRVQTSGVSYQDSPKIRALERRRRKELIEQLEGRPSITATGHARAAVTADLPTTFGSGERADVIGVVIALTCP